MTLWCQVLEVLIPEEEHLALGGIECKLVQALLRELGDLHAGDLSTEVWADMGDLGFGGEKVRLGRVSAEANVDMLYQPVKVSCGSETAHDQTYRRAQ